MTTFSNNKINITLCGMMGSGKSTIGKLLAKKLNFGFIDTDKLIEEKTGKSIKKIFIENGENYFRQLEKKIIINILKNPKCVISLGGGSILSNSIRNMIQINSYNIYLEVHINTLVKRLTTSNKRPLIMDKDINKTLNELIKKREKFYKEADIIINNETQISKIIENILLKLKKND